MNKETSTSLPDSRPSRDNRFGIFVFILLLFGLLGFSAVRYAVSDMANFDARMRIILSVSQAAGFLGVVAFLFFSARLLRAALFAQHRTALTLPVAGVVVALAVGAMTYQQYDGYRAATRTDKSIQNLRVLSLALVAFGKERGVPVAHSRDAEFQPLLSWRVHLLEYFQEDLYQQFRLDEPWDSPHNSKLIAEMPSEYRSELAPNVQRGKTCYVMAVGQGVFYPYPASFVPNTEEQIFDWKTSDGQFGRRETSRRYSANTLVIVEVLPELAVIWTKPDDLHFDPERPKAQLVSDKRKFFLGVTADLVPRAFPSDLSDETVRNLFLDDRSPQLDITRIANSQVRKFETWTIYVRPPTSSR